MLREVQADDRLRRAIAAIGRATETTWWLSLLIETLFEAALIVLVPEIAEVWAVVADGVVDVGQLSVLLAAPLAEPLERIGATAPLEGDIVSVMRGDGPQQGAGAYGCKFHLYPLEAVDPADGMPKDRRHTWTAPGGWGDHNLPPDFLVGTLLPRDGARVLVMVGPDSGGTRFTRAISATRTFNPLRARVAARQLRPSDARPWLELLRRGGGP